jgi:hypothetical protein
VAMTALGFAGSDLCWTIFLSALSSTAGLVAGSDARMPPNTVIPIPKGFAHCPVAVRRVIVDRCGGVILRRGAWAGGQRVS